MANEIDKTTLVKSVIHRLITPSSFVAKVPIIQVRESQELVTLATFLLSNGAWIVQAKATVEDKGGDFDPENKLPSRVRANLILVSYLRGGTTLASDSAQVDTDFNHATVVAAIGFNASSTAWVELRASFKGSHGNHKAEFSSIVLIGIKQDELITMEL